MTQLAEDIFVLELPESPGGARELVWGNRQAFKQQAFDAITGGRARLALLLEDAAYIDSAGLGALITIARRAKEHGGGVIVVGASEELIKLFHETNLDTVFQLVTQDAWIRDGWPS